MLIHFIGKPIGGIDTYDNWVLLSTCPDQGQGHTDPGTAPISAELLSELLAQGVPFIVIDATNKSIGKMITPKEIRQAAHDAIDKWFDQFTDSSVGV